ncbi:Unknown protein sequence [Pseudomonas syringae pv. helianthi]|uniref:Uncharacterized protein n=3 Tax=Pseudomonas syringae group TaxID=136849 RepID=A0A0P9KVS0_9PSED|nr:Unknown protein sequence [Pseudomonas caricapapayae]KPX50270.1 Unknown protein sequence [Pseudomonas syringae pv. helianthi]KPY82814.1 Unknown protein sequence [Pseudomonas syringae pv. tagetis]RMM06779.1 hypothetical protein ALQ84_02483 [Pseudomonas caricapapayae]RMQ98947.1 hypothetical protein ALP93_02474 [Pseudomonas syringae pv. helianthi]
MSQAISMRAACIHKEIRGTLMGNGLQMFSLPEIKG